MVEYVKGLWNNYSGTNNSTEDDPEYNMVLFKPVPLSGTVDGVLGVQGIDFHINANGRSHHTSQFNLMTRAINKCLVVRRGQPFKLDLLLNRPYNSHTDAISFIFYVSDTKMRGPSAGTTAAVPMLDKGSDTEGEWSAVNVNQMGLRLKVAVTAAVDCIVAAWKIDVDTRLMGGSFRSYTHPQPVYVLFNPWCSTDSVYMPGEERRAEFVEEDGGLIFKGTYNRIRPMPWNFAQYENDILDCALYLVKVVGKVRGRERGDPILTSRALSAAVNTQDDNGVLYGKWLGDISEFSNGTHPVQWVGSLTILQKYYETKMSVKYAQCWVYAGVLTTICRALGIPCRPVTGYSAGHDSQGSLTIDTLKDKHGETMNVSKDSIWNYHVWNEVWMQRPDLGAEYGGWQVVDGTPQEMSDRMYRCGPASLRAIKEAELQRPYDAPYVFAQVNADWVTWKYNGRIQPLKLLSRNTSWIGKFISTKAIGKMLRQDITNSYKYPEKTRKERETMEKALRSARSKFARYYLNEVFNDVQFKFELRDDIYIGQDFTVVMRMRNISSENTHHVKGLFRVDTVSYTGAKGNNVKKSNFELKMKPEDKKVVSVRVTYKDYYDKLVDQGSFNISCLAKVVGIDFEYFAQDDFRVRSPDISMALVGKPKIQQQVKMLVQLKNPLPIPLKNGKFYVQGPGIEKQLQIELRDNVAPGSMAKGEFKLTPPWAGRHQISAKFSSKEMNDVDGYLSFMVGLKDTDGASSYD